eukprot:3725787-Rhodomonas_salina.3
MTDGPKAQPRQVHKLLEVDLGAFPILGRDSPCKFHPVSDDFEVVKLLVQALADGVGIINADVHTPIQHAAHLQLISHIHCQLLRLRHMSSPAVLHWNALHSNLLKPRCVLVLAHSLRKRAHQARGFGEQLQKILGKGLSMAVLIVLSLSAFQRVALCFLLV